MKMKSFHLLFTSLALISQLAAHAETRSTVIFEQVRLVDVASGQVSAPADLAVASGRILPAGSEPADAIRVSAAGKYLMPGLAEMHAHVPPERVGAQQIHDTLVLYLAHGITTIRGMLGEPSHLVLRQRLAAGELPGPRLITSGPSFNNRTIASPAAAAERARSQAEAGYDLLKLHPGLWPDAFAAIAETADALGMAYSGHVSVAVGLDRVLASRQGSIDHLDGYGQQLVPPDHPLHGTYPGLFAINLVEGMDPDLIPELARRTAESGIANVPTQSLIENWAIGDLDALMARPAMRWIPEATQAQWLEGIDRIRAGTSPEQGERFVEIRRALIGALHEAGAVLLLGADAPQILNIPGDAIHHELETYVASGLSPAEALATGTVNVARYFDQSDRYACLQSGCIADLVLLDANPLDDIRNSREIEGVMRAGRWFDRQTLDRMLEEVAARAAGKS
ncbi:amidohydrolase family protein [Wenzhouxiangella limi]|uniref:Amidohydrolase family protein n=1 Tax=Wenzhouxiangella limi TaxID=2707351 RepID=A0A845V7W3_9GAMM|nr:amidohydrolase family protein [Wenzhouxiangella limi]NDY96015.1 amidohydrolase family protein [Wenzhouxiangella limi]